jgi:DNA (cytosine-5)-methyltransferase 1
LTYYNDNEPYVVQWLQNLIGAGHISEGTVDGRPIQEVQAKDLLGAKWAHFFAGIGGWDLALQLAGWPEDQPVWTGSCPCQPFSTANVRKRNKGSRDLFPIWLRLIKECKPATIFGEQVGGPDGIAWFHRVRLDLEAEGYAVGAANLCASGVSSQRRPRIFFVADADSDSKCYSSVHEKMASLQEAWALASEPWREIRGMGAVGDEFPSKMGRLRAYGNSINPVLAGEFVMAYREITT